MDRGADPAALDRRVALPGMAGDQQDDPLLVNERLFNRPVDGLPGALQAVAMKVDDTIGLDHARAKPAIPA